MLTDGHDGSVARAADHALERRQPPARVDDLALDQALSSRRDRAKVRRVEGPADAQEVPEPGLGQLRHSHGRAVVKQGRGAPAVQVAEPVAVVPLDGVLVRHARVRGRRVRGDDGQVRCKFRCPVLCRGGGLG